MDGLCVSMTFDRSHNTLLFNLRCVEKLFLNIYYIKIVVYISDWNYFSFKKNNCPQYLKL